MYKLYTNYIQVLNLSLFNIKTGINELKTLTKYISYEFKCKFDRRKCNSDQWWNNDKCWFECKKRHLCGKDYIWNPATCGCKNWKYLESIMDDSVIACDEIIVIQQTKKPKLFQQILMKRKQLVKHKISIF